MGPSGSLSFTNRICRVHGPFDPANGLCFDRSKVLRGIQRSCEKRPVSAADMERMASEIEQELQNSLEREVSTVVIGEKVMEKLKKADEVAYVRFASVYRQFKDINTFMSELNKLLSEK